MGSGGNRRWWSYHCEASHICSPCQVRMGSTTCLTSTWTSSTSVNCRSAAGRCQDAICLQVSFVQSDFSFLQQGFGSSGTISYDAPVIFINSKNAPAATAEKIVFSGLNFGRAWIFFTNSPDHAKANAGGQGRSEGSIRKDAASCVSGSAGTSVFHGHTPRLL